MVGDGGMHGGSRGGYSLVEVLIALAISSLAAAATLDGLGRAMASAKRISEVSNRVGAEQLNAAVVRHVLEGVIPAHEGDPGAFEGSQRRLSGITTNDAAFPGTPGAPYFFEMAIEPRSEGGGRLLYRAAPLAGVRSVDLAADGRELTLLEWDSGPAEFHFTDRAMKSTGLWSPANDLVLRSRFESDTFHEGPTAPELIALVFDDELLLPIVAATIASSTAPKRWYVSDEDDDFR